jgi:hypothetical protein
MDVLAATWSRRNVSTLRSLELQTMCQGSAAQPVWSTYRKSLREVVLNQTRECFANLLGKFSSTGLENYSECVREVLLNPLGECTVNVLGKLSLTGLENVQRIC